VSPAGKASSGKANGHYLSASALNAQVPGPVVRGVVGAGAVEPLIDGASPGSVAACGPGIIFTGNAKPLTEILPDGSVSPVIPGSPSMSAKRSTRDPAHGGSQCLLPGSQGVRRESGEAVQRGNPDFAPSTPGVRDRPPRSKDPYDTTGALQLDTESFGSTPEKSSASSGEEAGSGCDPVLGPGGSPVGTRGGSDPTGAVSSCSQSATREGTVSSAGGERQTVLEACSPDAGGGSSSRKTGKSGVSSSKYHALFTGSSFQCPAQGSPGQAQGGSRRVSPGSSPHVGPADGPKTAARAAGTAGSEAVFAQEASRGARETQGSQQQEGAAQTYSHAKKSPGLKRSQTDTQSGHFVPTERTCSSPKTVQQTLQLEQVRASLRNDRVPPRDVVLSSAHAAAVTNYFGQRNLLLEHRLMTETVVTEAMRDAGGDLKSCVKNLIKPFVVGVCGATCSGKTTLCNIFRRELRENARVAFIPADSFYKDLDDAQRQLAYKSQYDFDHPDAIAWDELTSSLKTLKRGSF